jgi:hypothetical protein
MGNGHDEDGNTMIATFSFHINFKEHGEENNSAENHYLSTKCKTNGELTNLQPEFLPKLGIILR